MFVSLQTYHSIQTAVRSTVIAVNVLLQRQLGKRNDNPAMAKFGYNDNTIRIQRDTSFTSRNMHRKYSKRNSWIEVFDETVPKPKIIVNIIKSQSFVPSLISERGGG